MNNIVCGPPGAGKTSFVMRRKSYGDLIVDLDAIYHALTGLPYYEKPEHMLSLVLATREFLISKIKPRDNKFYHAWVITGGADPDDRHELAARLNARVYVIEASPPECVRHIANDPRRAAKFELWTDLVNKWWDKYKPDARDVVVTPEQALKGVEAKKA